MLDAPLELRRMTDQAWSEASRGFLAVAAPALLYAKGDLVDNGAPTRLYAICEADGAAWKFGIGENPDKRIGTLQVGNPRRLLLFAHAPGTRALEAAIHHVLRRHRLSGEWFARSTRTLAVAALIRSAGEQCGDLDLHGLGPADAEDAIGCVTFQYEELLACRVSVPEAAQTNTKGNH